MGAEWIRSSNVRSDQFCLLEERRQALDQKRQALLDELATLSEQQLTAKPTPDQWSLLQVAQHLMLGERHVLQKLPEFSELTARNRSPRDRILSWVVLAVFRLGIRVKVPSSAMEPDGNTTLEEVREEWGNCQAWLKEFVATLDAESADLAVFRHPVAGPLTISQVLTSTDVHFDSHRQKIEARLRQFRNANAFKIDRESSV